MGTTASLTSALRSKRLLVRAFVFTLALAARVACAQGAGYWHTSGNLILDANNAQVRIAGINWYGFETTAAVAHGLSSQDYKAVLQTVKDEGYNTVRLPFSNQMIETPSSTLNISYYNSTGPINTDLQGLNSLQVMDKIIVAAGSLGLKIILDDHRSEAGDSAEASGLWFTPAYPESAWIADWTMLAQRYQHNSTVIGFDLRNEPHNAYSGGACWDCGGASDWHLAAQRAGNAVLAVNPQLLIFVEGTDAYNNDYYWWGGNLEGVATSPVTLATPNQLVYSAHEYGPHEYAQTWFNASTTYSSLSSVWSKHWAYVSQNNFAPVWVGEFGTTNNASDIQGSGAGTQAQWFSDLITYLSTDGTLNWTYWALNGEDSYGLLDSNYDATPASALKQSALATIQFKLSTGTAATNPPAAPTALTATTVSSGQVNLTWTASATAGAYYTVYFGTSASSVTTVLGSGVTATNLLATGLNPAITYYFAVAAVSTGGTSGLSNVATATTQTVTLPAAPTGLTASVWNSSQIQLTWVAGSGAGVTYSVYAGSAAGGNTLLATGVTAPVYVAAGLTAGTAYSFTVTATNSAGTSAASAPVSATTQAAPVAPTAPAALTASALSASQINLSWTASTGTGVYYSVYQSTVAGVAGTLVANGLGATNYAATNLVASTTYYYTVTASNGGGTSAASNTASATTTAAAATAAPAAPTGLMATSPAASQIDLAWTASATANVTYNVYGGTGSASTLLAADLRTLNYVVNGLTASTTYSFTVVAMLNGVASAASNVATATTAAGTVAPPAAPAALTASAVSASEVDLAWKASTTAGVTYSVYGGLSTGANSVLMASGLTGTTYAATGLAAGMTYQAYVVAVAGSGSMSPASNVVIATTPVVSTGTPTQPTAPAAPTNLTATATSSTQISLSWTASTTAGVTYTIYGIVGTSAAAPTVVASGLMGTGYSVTGLTPSTVYSYSVMAVSAASGNSAPSNGASATTPAVVPPAAPTGLTATATSVAQVNLAWTASTTASVTYNVYSGTAAGAETALVAGNVGGASYSVTGLTSATAYYFVVKAVAAGGSGPEATSAASNEATATTQTATAGGCHVDYTVFSDWGTGFTTGINITNNSKTALTSWTLTWTFTGNQQLIQSWNGDYTQTGKAVTIKSAAWNGAIEAGGTAPGIGFNANYSGSNAAPVFYLNGVACK